MLKQTDNDLRDRTKRFALQIICMFTALPKTIEAQVIGKQILRSGTSVGLIIERHIAAAAEQNLSQKLATVSKNLKRPHIGWNFSLRVALLREIVFLNCGQSATSLLQYLLR